LTYQLGKGWRIKRFNIDLFQGFFSFTFILNMDYFVHKDGQENRYDDKGMAVAVVEMEVDEEMYPIETVTNFGMYHELKAPENPEKNNANQQEREDVKIKD